MPRASLVIAALVLAGLAGCGKGKPAPETEEAIDAQDPLFAVALARTTETLYGTKGDFLVARKAGGNYFLECVPWREGFPFRPGQVAPADAAEAARTREFRIRKLLIMEWHALRVIVTEQKVFERRSADPRGLSTRLLVCGAKNVILGATRAQPDPVAEQLARLLNQYAVVDGKPWVAPEEPLPPDAVDKILVVSVGEVHLRMGGSGSSWSFEASRDKEGAWITGASESHEGNPDPDAEPPPAVFIPDPPRYKLTEDEWKGLLEFIRKQDLLHWTPPHIIACDGGDSFVTIRTVRDFRYHWSLGLNQDAKASALAAELRKLFERKAK